MRSFCIAKVGVGGSISISEILKFYVKVFYVMGKALSGELSCPCDRSCCPLSQQGLTLTGKNMLLEEQILSCRRTPLLEGSEHPFWAGYSLGSSLVREHLFPVKQTGNHKNVSIMKKMAEKYLNYTPALKKWGVYWFTSVCGSVRPSVRPSITLFRQRYLHNHLR